jgi:peptidylprolyl isomerase
MPRLRTWSLVVLTAATLGLAGCGSSSASSSTTTTAAAPSSAPTGSGSTSSVATIPVADRSPAGTFGTEPTVNVPSGAPPTLLESTDLITGTGPAAKAGDTVTVQYVLATYSSGKVVQASWTSQPFSFTLGEGQVIPGWDQGVVGMQVGGRRELLIPPKLGYGSTSPGAGIGVNDTLVFVVDMLKIT